MAAELITRLVIDSAYGPQVVIDKPLASDPSASPSRVMSILKPQITVITPLGNKVIAPWGKPGETRWPEVQIALLALLVALLIGVMILL